MEKRSVSSGPWQISSGDLTAQIDAIAKKVEASSAMLREDRTALISAAVTGKIDVREDLVS